MDNSLRAITINGALRVESYEDILRKKEERRRNNRKTRWDSSQDILGKQRENEITTLKVQGTQVFNINIHNNKRNESQNNIDCNSRSRSLSPEPLYNEQGLRINKRNRSFSSNFDVETEKRRKIEEKMQKLDPTFHSSSSSKSSSKPFPFENKVFIPSEEYPHINFMGLLLGPRGNYLEEIKKETKCNIIIRGKGSLKAGMTGISKEGHKLAYLNEPLHAVISGRTSQDVSKGTEFIQELLSCQIYHPNSEKASSLRSKHMRELAVLNGTLLDVKCRNCGKEKHKTWECTESASFSSSVLCSSCGSFGHLTKDCHQSRPGSSWKTFEEKKAFDEEYNLFLKDMELQEKSNQRLKGTKMKGQPYSETKDSLHATLGSEATSPLVPRKELFDSSASSSAYNSLGNLQSLGPSNCGGKQSILSNRIHCGFVQREIERKIKQGNSNQIKSEIPLEWKIESLEKKMTNDLTSYLSQLKEREKEEFNSYKNRAENLLESFSSLDLPNLIETPNLLKNL